MSSKFIDQKAAQELDEYLMHPDKGAFSLDQLIELAGLSVAQAVASTYPLTRHKSILVCAGPGNNGGDGLVAARHLFHFGYNVVVYYPKKTDKPIYQNLQKQLHALHISFVDDFTGALSKADVVIDAIFGFGFNGNVRAPFDTVLDVLKNVKIPIAAVDIPSGWSVEKGDPGNGIKPDLLVSLSAPKRGVEKYTGKHFLGGRFVPPDLADEMGFNTPWKTHGGTEQCVDISQWLKL